MEYDLLRGKVTAYPGEEEKGLVEVSLGGYDQDQDKLYARVEQTLSGVYWLPEIGEVVEVLVPKTPGYEAHVLRVRRAEGDALTQACWSEHNDRKQITTRSGHTVLLDDTQDKTALTLRSAGGLELALEDEPQTVTVKSGEGDTPRLLLDFKNDELTLSAGKKCTIRCGDAAVELDSGGNITIKAKGSLELSGQQITLNAQNNLTLKGQQLELSGGMTAKLTAQTQLELSSSGITEVKGSMVKLN